jgi:hypothetical protein
MLSQPDNRKTAYFENGIPRSQCWARKNDPKAWLYLALRSRAQSKGIPFDLEFDDLMEVWPEDGLCPVLGIPMKHNQGRGGAPNSASIDKIIPDRGYVKGNVMWLSSRANKMKGENTIQTLERILALVRAAEHQAT